MKIYLIRHAIAGDRMQWAGDDGLRPLTPKGMKKMRQIVKGLKNLRISLDYLFTSPLVRARETAEIVAQGIRVKGEIQELEALEPDGIPSELLSSLNRLENEAYVGLVGHEPHISRTISYFLSGNYTACITVKKGGVAAFEADKPLSAQRIELKWLLEPKQLVAIGKSGRV